MKKWLILAIVCAAVCGFCDDDLTFYDGSRLATITASGATTTTVATISGNDVGVQLFKASYGAGYTEDKPQDFKKDGGWEIVTGFVANVSANMGALTSSNLSVNSDGCYMLMSSFSMDSSESGLQVLCHAYTNSVQVISAGCSAYFPTKSQDQNMTLVGIVCLSSNDYIDIRFDVDKDCTMTFVHKGAKLIKIGP